jgi:hypothetical protein
MDLWKMDKRIERIGRKVTFSSRLGVHFVFNLAGGYQNYSSKTGIFKLLFFNLVSNTEMIRLYLSVMLRKTYH